jgi:hypothetical protein
MMGIQGANIGKRNPKMTMSRPTPKSRLALVDGWQGIEMVWVSKLAEPIDENWFSQETADLILVAQGQLKFEFELPGQPDRVLSAPDNRDAVRQHTRPSARHAGPAAAAPGLRPPELKCADRPDLQGPRPDQHRAHGRADRRVGERP